MRDKLWACQNCGTVICQRSFNPPGKPCPNCGEGTHSRPHRAWRRVKL